MSQGEGDLLGSLPLQPKTLTVAPPGLPQALVPPLAARPPFSTRWSQHPGLCPVCSPSPGGTGPLGPLELTPVPTVDMRLPG